MHIGKALLMNTRNIGFRDYIRGHHYSLIEKVPYLEPVSPVRGVARYFVSRKHAFVILTPINPTFI